MHNGELDILSHRRGSVSAPAGCGKTQLIAFSLMRNEDSKPALVLTHTNAGKSALEQRLKKLGVNGTAARVGTLDSWAIRLVQCLPQRSGLSPAILQVQGNNANYLAIRQAAVEILKAGHADKIITATYSRVIVDEYQDCGSLQHEMILALANLLPTVVLGDPLQVIFNFSGPVVDWHKEVVAAFPSLMWETEPWRWKNAGAPELGEWLLNTVRPALSHAGGSIDLSKVPKGVEWVRLEGTATEMSEARLGTAKRRFEGPALIIADSKNKDSQWETARRSRSTMVEANDMVDFMKFAATFDPTDQLSLDHAVTFFGNLLSGLSPKNLVARTRSLHAGRALVGANRIEEIALAYLRVPSHRSAADMLDAFYQTAGIFAFRPDITRLCSQALRAVNGNVTFHSAAVRERERFRHTPRTTRPRSVGSTLLLKGLESDVAIILEPEKMNAENLYVAMTRGSKQLIICSSAQILKY